jgi:hypothetical protein
MVGFVLPLLKAKFCDVPSRTIVVGCAVGKKKKKKKNFGEHCNKLPR